MHRREFRKLLQKYSAGACTPEEKAFVEEWYRAMGQARDQDLSGLARKEIKERAWRVLQEYVSERKKADGVGRTPRLLEIKSHRVQLIAAAAALFIMAAVFFVVRPRTSDHTVIQRQDEREFANTGAEAMDIRLSDGSVVSLAPGSRLTYTSPFHDSLRLVVLQGEAFFRVSRDTLHPFVVNTNEVITRVLGTSFTVSAFPDEQNIIVSVKTGKVSVAAKKGNDMLNGAFTETILTPNQKIIYNKGDRIVSLGIVDEPLKLLPPSAMERMHFEGAPVSKIFDGLEKVYGVEIDFDPNVFSSCTLTTSIAEGNIYDRLDMICKAIDARYVLKENHIVIEGNGCVQNK